MTPNRALFVVTTLDVGGAERHLEWLCRGLLARGWRARVVYLKGEGRLAPSFEALGVPVERLALGGVRGSARAVRGLARRIRDWRPDVLHSHLLKADVVAAAAARLARPAAFVQSKHNEEQILKRRPVAFLHGLVARSADRIVALSEHVRRYVVEVGRAPPDRVETVYYGIDPRPFELGDRRRVRARLGLDPDEHVALCVARFHPQKDHETLLAAFRRLLDQGRAARLLFAGGDPFYDHGERVARRVRELGLQGSVELLGIRDDVPDLLAAADLFVLPSRFEGLGLVFLEAMAASRPVLATATSAIPEVVRDGVTGRLVAVGDPAALAEAWAWFLDHPREAERMGRAGRDRVRERFGLERMIDGILNVYERAWRRG